MKKRNDVPLLSLADSCIRLARQSCGKVISHDGKYIMASSPESFFYSRYLLLDGAGNEISDILEMIVNETANGRPPQLSFDCSVHGKDYEELLESHGFFRMFNQTGMILSGILERGIQEIPSDMDIRILGKEDLAEWCTCIYEGFGPPKAREDEMFFTLLNDSDVSYYGCFTDGKMAGGSMLISDREYAGIHEVATLGGYRNRGICSSLVKKMCNDLFEKGIDEVSLQASPMGKQVYQKLGFEEAGMVSTWLLQK